MTTALWWIRRDLRLTDNQALAAALAHADRVLPVFVLDPALLASSYVGDKRLAFLLDGLRQLDADLRARGSYLVVRRGNPQDELTALLAESGAEAVFAEEDFSPYARYRDTQVADALPLHLTSGLTVHPPGTVLKADGTPYTVFTPFSRKWKALPPPQVDVRRDGIPPDSPLPRLVGPSNVLSLPIPTEPAPPPAAPFSADVRRDGIPPDSPPPRLLGPSDVPSLPIPTEPASPPAAPFPADVRRDGIPPNSPLSPAAPFSTDVRRDGIPPDSPPPRLVGPSNVRSLSIPTQPALPSVVPFPPGEAEAQRRLRAFADGDDPPIYRYSETRNRLDVAGTSQLSPYLRFGMLSARQAAVAALTAIAAAPNAKARNSAETWLNELIWREFFVSILYHFPQVRKQSFRVNLKDIAWENDEAAFTAWCEGRTGYPVVDAAMRQLVQTGWMHNRARMIVASFLVKDLLIDWRWGERWFMQHLVDGDPAANNGGWQWTAGTGTDAAPYFRVFNPVLQSKKFDPDGTCVRHWVPELHGVPDKFIHQPWKMPLDVQQAAGCIIGQHYPAPIVDHAWARKRALAAYAEARESSDTVD